MRQYHTTKKHFKIFKAECLKCIKSWGINDWSINIVHEKLDNKKAVCKTNLTGRTVTIGLSTDYGVYPFTVKDIVDSARHECTHLLLSRVVDLGDTRFVMEEEYKAANESLVRQLTKLLP